MGDPKKPARRCRTDGEVTRRQARVRFKFLRQAGVRIGKKTGDSE